MSKTSQLRNALVTGASAAAFLALAAPALAAPAPTPAPAPQTADDQLGATAVVVVTAEKRAENLQKVPEAVSAFTAKQRNVEGIVSIQDISNFTPGLTYSSSLDRASMRGLARLSNSLAADSSVAIYIDDFYSTSTYFVGLDDLFVDHVDVERGPQGTLYGRNAIGGLINTTSRYPTDHLTGEVRLSYGNYDHAKIEGTVSGPLSPDFTVRLAGLFDNQDQGYFTNVAGGPSEGGVVHDYYGSAMFEWKPTNRDDLWLNISTNGFINDRGGPGSLISIPTTGVYDKGEDAIDAAVAFNPNFGYATFSGFNAYGQANGPIPGTVTGIPVGFPDNPALQNIRDFAHTYPTDINLTGSYSVNFHYTHHFDGVDMKYVGGYSQYNIDLKTYQYDTGNSSVSSYEIPLLPSGYGGLCAGGALGPCGPLTVYPAEQFHYVEHNHWTSHELTFSSTNNGPLQWIAGAFFYYQFYDSPVTIANPSQTQIGSPYYIGATAPTVGNPFGLAPAPASAGNVWYNTNYNMTNQSEALYGQVDYKITDTLKLTGGLRFTYDSKSGNEEYRVILFSDQLASGLPSLGLPAGALTAENLGNHLPALDVTAFNIATGAYPGVTCAPYLVTSGQFAGSYERCLGGNSSAVTGTAGVEWTPDPSTLVYLRYNRGYKALGFNAGYLEPSPEAKPEFVDDLEGGIKQSFGHKFQYNLDAFYYNYANDQVPAAYSNGAVTSTAFINIPQALSTGFEFQAIWEPVERLIFNLTYSFDYTEVLSGCTATGASSGVGTCLEDAYDPTGIAPNAKKVFTQGGAVFQSIKGNELPQAPRNKLALNANYTWLFDPGNLTFSASYIWKDKEYYGIFTRWYNEAPAYSQVDLRLVWSGNHDHYEIVGYVKNLFNTVGYDAAGEGYLTSVPYTQVSSYDLSPPRTFGVEFHYKF